jgi:hypothetical protein
MADNFQVFQALISNRLKAGLFLLSKLPSAFFSGVRVKEINRHHCTVVVPYKWFSRNPFRSTYFACLSMAAEMSTGALCMGYIYKRQPSVSMLVVRIESNYFSKADGITKFTCTDGEEISQTIEKATATGEAQTFVARSVGINERGDKIAEMLVTWSFKSRK